MNGSEKVSKIFGGHVAILDWIKNSRRFVYQANVIDIAAKNGHVSVLDWFYCQFGNKLKYSKQAMDMASEFGQIHVLDWWKNSGLPLLYTNIAMDVVSE